MLFLQFVVILLLFLNGLSKPLEPDGEFESSGQEDNENSVSTTALSRSTFNGDPLTYRYINVDKNMPKLNLFKSLDEKLDKVEGINRRLQTQNLTLGQLNQFLESNYSTSAIYLYAAHVYPQVFTRVANIQIEKWTKAKNDPNATIGGNLFIENPFAFLGETLALMFFDIAEGFSSSFNISYKVPVNVCSFVLRHTNQSTRADKLDALIKNTDLPEEERVLQLREYYSQLHNKKKCPNLVPFYTTALKLSKSKIEKFVEEVRNITIRPCEFFPKEATQKELKDDASESKETEDKEDPVDDLDKQSAFIANALYFAQHLDNDQNISETEIDVALQFFEWTGYPLNTRIQQLFVAIVSGFKNNMTIHDLDATLHLFYNEVTQEVKEQSAEIFETEKEEKFGNGTQTEMEELIHKIMLTPTGPKLEIAKFNDNISNLTIINSSGRNQSLSIFHFLTNAIANSLANTPAQPNEIAENQELKLDIETMSLNQESNFMIRQVFTDPPPNDVTFPYHLRDILNCTFESNTSLANESDEIPVQCNFNFEPLFKNYNTTKEKYFAVLNDNSKKYDESSQLAVIVWIAIGYEDILVDEYDRVVQQVQNKRNEQALPDTNSTVEIGDVIEEAELENVHIFRNNTDLNRLLIKFPVDFIPSVFEANLRIMTGQYEMPSYNSYEPIRRRMASFIIKPTYYCVSTPVRFLYSSVRAALLNEAEESKLEIFHQLDEYLRCSARAIFQRVYHKRVKLVVPSVPDREFKCEPPKEFVI